MTVCVCGQPISSPLSRPWLSPITALVAEAFDVSRSLACWAAARGQVAVDGCVIYPHPFESALGPHDRIQRRESRVGVGSVVCVSGYHAVVTGRRRSARGAA